MKATEICRLSLPECFSHDVFLLPDLAAAVVKTEGVLRLYSAEQDPASVLKGDPQSQLFTVSSSGQRVLWSTPRNRVFTSTTQDTAPKELLNAPYHLSCLAISNDACIVAAGGSALTSERAEYEQELRVYKAGEPYDYGEYRPPVRPNPGLGPGHVRIWDLISGNSRVLDGFHSGVSGIAFSSDRSMLAAFDDKVIRIFDLASMSLRIQIPKQNTSRLQAFIFRPDGNFLLAGDISEIWRYDINAMRTERVLALDGSYRNCITFDGTGCLVAVGYERGVICLYDNLSGEELCSITTQKGPELIALSTTGERLFALVGGMLIGWQLG